MSTRPSPPPAPAATMSAQHKICFNSHCKESKSESASRRGWRLRSGEFADLCDGCYGPFEQGIFCETFHLEVAGWRKCETCGKGLHCGCVVSMHSYMLLDSGGVDCIPCARKSFLMTPGQVRSSSLYVHPQASENKNISIKAWRTSPGPYPGNWRQVGSLWNASGVQSDLQQRLAYEFDRPSMSEKMFFGSRPIHTTERKFDDMPNKMPCGGANQNWRDRYANGHPCFDQTCTYGLYHRDDGNFNGVCDPNRHAVDNDAMSSRKGVISNAGNRVPSPAFNLEGHPNPSVNALPPSICKEETPIFSPRLSSHFQSPKGGRDGKRVASAHAQGQLVLPRLPKHFYPQNVVDVEMQESTIDEHTGTGITSHSWLRNTKQEEKQITGDTNAVLTPLFEKMLSASDAGRIGRLVLPKKSAEAHFPSISNSEGLPIKVQDTNGKEWLFQFRFWPNNNSRMYVLEGVTPCIQSMQLQAGDIVTFSRADPGGKLIMGFRKSSSYSTEQDNQMSKSGNGLPEHLESKGSNSAADTVASLRQTKGGKESRSVRGTADSTSESKLEKIDPRKEVRTSAGHGRRKVRGLSAGIKRLRINNEDTVLKVSCKEAQELFRPPPSCSPSVVNIDGHDFEEYEDPPVIGRKTYFIMSLAGETHQWAQCEECQKWRRLPVDSLVHFHWACSDNTWDPDRSSCSAAQELTVEQLSEVIASKPGASVRSRSTRECDGDEGPNGLDALADLAIDEECEGQVASTSQPTTRHPRHRAGCTCIVCIQPPSGKGPKHKQTCTCNVCATVKRRFRTFMMRRDKRQLDKEVEIGGKDEEASHNAEQTALMHDEQVPSHPYRPCAHVSNVRLPSTTAALVSDAANEETPGSEQRMPSSSSPIKGNFDLNIQPEREDEASPKLDATVL